MANLTKNIAASTSVTLNVPITVGILNIGDTDTTNNYVIAPGTSGTLTLNNNGSGAQINDTSTADGDLIQAPIVIADSGGLTITNSAAQTFVMNGAITSIGTGNLSFVDSGAGGVTYQTSTLNNTGTISVSGTGTGKVTLNAPIGSNVTNVSATNSGAFVFGNGATNTTVANNGTISLSNGGNITFGAGTISNAGSITITQSGSSTFSFVTGSGSFATTGYAVSWNNTGAVNFNGTSTGAISTVAMTGTSVTTFGSNVTDITFGTGAAVTTASSTSAQYTVFDNTGNLTFTINGTNALTLSNVANSIDNTGSLIFNGTTNSAITLGTGITGSNVTTVVQNDPNNVLTLNATSTANSPVLSGGIQILAGEFESNGGGTSTGTANATITLGSSTTNASATFFDNGSNIANAFSVGTSTGTLNLQAHNNSAIITFSGGLALNGSDTLTILGTPVTMSGGVTGTGNIVLTTSLGGTPGDDTDSFTNSVNNGGVFTNNTTGTVNAASVVISGAVGSNVTGFTQSSTNVPLKITGGLAVNSAGTTLTNNAASLTSTGGILTVSTGAITGTGTLTLDNNTTFNNAISITSAIQNSGPIANGGTGTGTETIAAIASTNVTGVIQNSNASALTVTSVLGAGNLALVENGSAGLTLTSGNNTGSLTGSGSGSGTILLTTLGSGVTGVTQNSAASDILQINGNNTLFGGTVSVLGGTLLLNNAGAVGTSTVNLGAVSGSSNSNLTLTGSLNLANAINVGSSSGTMEVSNTGSSAGTVTYSGPVTLNSGTFTVLAGGTGTGTALTGGISGTGDVVLLSNSSTAAVAISTNDIGNTGAIINSGTGTSTSTITASVDDTVTGITENSSTSPLTMSGGFLFDDSTGITLTNNASSGSTGIVTVSDAIIGTGTITLKNNSAIANGITLTPSGSATFGIVNSGTGSGTETIGFVLGGTKTVTQNSATSPLQLTQANTYNGGTTVSAGQLVVTNTTGSATGGGTLLVNTGASLAGTGAVRGTTNTINGTVYAGNTGGTDVNTIGTLTLTSSGTTTFSNAGLVFNLRAATPIQGNELNVGSSAVMFSGLDTLTLNLIGTDTHDIAGGTDFILFVGTSGSQYSGLTLSGTRITNLKLVFTGTASNGEPNSLYYGSSYLFLSGGDIEVAILPEPGTWVLMLSGFAAILFCQRVRRNRDI